MQKFIAGSYKKTQKLGEALAKSVLALPRTQGRNNAAIIFALQGNLGAGKTTFLQGFAKGLRVKEKILSPTFVIMKKFKIKTNTHDPKGAPTPNTYYHIDCYRIKNEKDILELGFKDMIKNPENIMAIEWPEKIKKLLPKNTIFINFKFIDESKREIIINF